MKKIFAIVLSVCMMLSVFSVAVFADEAPETDTFVGYSATRVVKEDLTTIPNITAFYDYPDTQKVFKITSAEGMTTLSGLMGLGIDFATYTIYLANDINMEDTAWTPYAFKGTLDGQGFMIQNLVCNTSDAAGWPATGLFASMTDATVKNLILGDGCKFLYTQGAGKAQVGSIVGSMNGGSTIENCYSAAEVQGNETAGGLVGITQSKGTDTIRYCTFAGTAKCPTAWRATGGILGTGTSKDVTIQYCRNIGTVTGSGSEAANGVSGGMIGRSYGENTVVMNCINNGTVTLLKAGASTGSMIGSMINVKAVIKNCINYGTLTGANTGFCANNSGATVEVDGNVDGEGVDPTLAAATLDYTPNYTPNEGNPTPPPSTGDEGGDSTEDPTTEAPTTETPTTQAPTTQAPATSEPAEEKKGCGSSIGGLALVLMVSGAAITVCKKKKD